MEMTLPVRGRAGIFFGVSGGLAFLTTVTPLSRSLRFSCLDTVVS